MIGNKIARLREREKPDLLRTSCDTPHKAQHDQVGTLVNRVLVSRFAGENYYNSTCLTGTKCLKKNLNASNKPSEHVKMFTLPKKDKTINTIYLCCSLVG